MVQGARISTPRSLDDFCNPQPKHEEKANPDEVQNRIHNRRRSLKRNNLLHNPIQRLSHLLPPKQLLHPPLPSLPHLRQIHITNRQRMLHDRRPSFDISRIAQPAGLGVEDGLDGAAGVGGKHGGAAQHGLEGHDAEVLVGGRVDEQAGGVQERGFEGGGDREEEDDGDGGRRGEGGDEVVVGEVREGEGVGEGFEFGVVFDVFGDSRVVAACVC